MNNTQLHNAEDQDVVMRMHHLIKYSNNYSKTRGSLWQYYIASAWVFFCQLWHGKI